MLETCDQYFQCVMVGQGLNEKVKSKEKEGAWIQHDYQSGFDITGASKIMDILAFSRDLADMQEKLGTMVVGLS